MGSILGAFVGSMCTGICCNTCRQCEGQKYGVISRLPYIFLFFISGVFSIVMSLYGSKALNLEFYTTSICNSSTCIGNGSVYRVSFILFVFELIHVIIIGFGFISFHWLLFIMKLFIFAACLTLTFIAGDSSSSNLFFQGYADYFARYVSAIYLLLQILILISYAHNINEYLQTKGNGIIDNSSRESITSESEIRNNSNCNKYFCILGIVTIGLYAISLTLCGIYFVWYVPESSCDLQKTIISITIIMVVLNFLISAIRGDGSLFVSSVLSFYVTFLCGAAMQANEDKTCNIFAQYRSTQSLWIGYILSFIAIFYAAFRADRIGILWEVDENEYILMDDDSEQNINHENHIKMEESKKEDNKKKKDDDNDNDDDDEDNKKKKEDDKKKEKAPSKQVQRISNVYFHFILMLAACYFAMLYSDWGTGTDLKSTGKQTMWVNIATQYVTNLLFWWTVLAPVICPSRFKKQQQDEEQSQHHAFTAV